jgi:hypothetical protein
LNCRSSLNPITRKIAVTVRQPGVRIAPVSKTCARGQTGSLNNGAKTLIMDNTSGDKLPIGRTSFWSKMILQGGFLLTLSQPLNGESRAKKLF